MATGVSVYIDSGRRNGFFTLRQIVTNESGKTENYHVMNLSTKWPKAVDKYRLYVKQHKVTGITDTSADEFELSSWGDEITTIKDDGSINYREWHNLLEQGKMPFGKYKTRFLKYLPDDYQEWLGKYAQASLDRAKGKHEKKAWTSLIEALV